MTDRQKRPNSTTTPYAGGLVWRQSRCRWTAYRADSTMFTAKQLKHRPDWDIQTFARFLVGLGGKRVTVRYDEIPAFCHDLLQRGRVIPQEEFRLEKGTPNECHPNLLWNNPNVNPVEPAEWLANSAEIPRVPPADQKKIGLIESLLFKALAIAELPAKRSYILDGTLSVSRPTNNNVAAITRTVQLELQAVTAATIFLTRSMHGPFECEGVTASLEGGSTQSQLRTAE